MTQEYYAAFIESSYHVPGDERSRTNPGHGYPAEDVKYTEVRKFGTLEELKQWVLAQPKYQKFEVVKCTPVKVETRVEVLVS